MGMGTWRSGRSIDSGGEAKVAVAVATEEESVVKLKSERRRSAHRLAEQTVVMTGEEGRLRRSLVAGGSRQI